MSESRSRDRVKEKDQLPEKEVALVVQRLINVYRQALGDNWQSVFLATVRVNISSGS